MTAAFCTSYRDVVTAAERIAKQAHRTPVFTCETLDRMAGRALYFKCEQFQRAGAFKFRGASNAVLQLSNEQAKRGVLTHSSGNHAQALALAAKLRGIDAHIVMPKNAAPVKRAAVADYGARITLCEPTLQAREDTSAEVAQRTGATFVHPYDHPQIIAGQGTATLELLAQVPELDAVITPVGGGGLLAGAAIAASNSPNIRVFAAEPKGADDAARSMAAKKLIPQTGPDTICDGLLTSLGEHNWAIISQLVEQVITVDDRETIAATKLLWQRAKLLVEVNAATTLAAVLTPAFKKLPALRHVGVVLSGGNAAFALSETTA
jgi:threonine dehydratase